MIRVLAVSGWNESVEAKSDKYGFWKIADELEAAGCEVGRRAWDDVSAEDLRQFYVWISYSYGTAGIEHARALLPEGEPRCLKWFVIAGVPRAAWQQTYDLWNAGGVVYAQAFNVTSIPASQGLRNPDGITRINVDCDGRTPPLTHISIQGDKTIRETICNEIKAMILVRG